MKNKIILILSLSLGMLFVSSNSFAGQVESTTVTSIQMNTSNIPSPQVRGLTLYTFADLPTDSPACATDPQGRMLTNDYSSEVDVLLDSYRNDSLVNVFGTGTCRYGFELIGHIILN